MNKKILILAANPTDTSKLRLDKEVREIENVHRKATNREEVEIISKWAVRVDDLRSALLYHKPNIVHFSGHGAGDDGLLLENQYGQKQLVNSESLAGLFKLFKEDVECVVMNACYSEVQAEAIHQHINCVIGMNYRIGDKAAIEFATGFYDALLNGRNYHDSFEFGRNALDLESIPESGIPQIKIKDTSKSLLDSDLINSKSTDKYDKKRLMEPLTTGAIALLLFCGEKFVEWGINKFYDQAFDKLKETSPDTAEKLALPTRERENIGEAKLVEMVENTAKNQPQLQEALEVLGQEVEAKANQNTELERNFNQLAEKIKAQNPTIVNENWQGINIKGGTNTITGNTFTFGK
ncbi:MAG: CHAT domain-containing protein [Cyanobacteria bacterium P01_A01_bin.68]